MKKSKDAIRNAAIKARDALEARGRLGFKPGVEVSRGRAIGFALYAACQPQECVDIALEMLEQWNGHLTVAAIAAIEKGQGKVSRNGRDLRIELPEHWADGTAMPANLGV